MYCDNCQKSFRETERMWLAYKFPRKTALCDECFLEANCPKTFDEVVEFLEIKSDKLEVLSCLPDGRRNKDDDQL